MSRNKWIFWLIAGLAHNQLAKVWQITWLKNFFRPFLIYWDQIRVAEANDSQSRGHFICKVARRATDFSRAGRALDYEVLEFPWSEQEKARAGCLGTEAPIAIPTHIM